MLTFKDLAAHIEKDANDHATKWRGKIIEFIEEACARANAKGIKSIILNPFSVDKIPTEDITVSFSTHILPVVMSVNILTFFDIISGIFDEKKIIGLGRHKLANVFGTMVTYMNTRIVQLFSLRDEQVDTYPPISQPSGEVIRASTKYLPSSYF